MAALPPTNAHSQMMSAMLAIIKSFLRLSMLRTKHRAKGFGGDCVVSKISRSLENL